MSASGSKVLIISSKKSPSACACTRKMSRHIGSPRSASPRTRLAADAGSSPRQLVVRVAGQEIRQQRSPDRRQRAERFEIARAPAVALGHEALDALDALVGNQHVTELAPEAVPALDDVAVDDDAAAEARADDGRDGGGGPARAEDREVSPQRAGIAVVEVGDGLAELVREGLAEVEAGPCRMDEVGGPARAQHARAARRPGRVEPDDHDVLEVDAGFRHRHVEAVGNLLQADVGPFLRSRRVLAQAVDQPALVAVDERVVDGRSPKVDPGDDGSRCADIVVGFYFVEVRLKPDRAPECPWT